MGKGVGLSVCVFVCAYAHACAQAHTCTQSSQIPSLDQEYRERETLLIKLLRFVRIMKMIAVAPGFSVSTVRPRIDFRVLTFVHLETQNYLGRRCLSWVQLNMYRPFLLSLLPKHYGIVIVSIVFALHLITQRWPHLGMYYVVLVKGSWAPVNFSEWSWNQNPDIPRVTVCISNAWASRVLFFSPWFLEKQTKCVSTEAGAGLEVAQQLSTCCSFRGPDFGSHDSYSGCSQPPLTLALRNWCLLALSSTYTYMYVPTWTYTHIHRQF